MRKLITVSLMVAALSACASQYGNYTTLSDALNAQMADDTAHKLAAVYPPAATHLGLLQSPKDAYGVELVKKLRENGYAIEDNSSGFGDLFATTSATPANSGSNTSSRIGQADNKALVEKPISIIGPASPAIPATSNAPAASSRPNTPLGYVVDQMGEGLYRVTVSVGVQALSRVYQVSGNKLAPAGSWTRKE